MSTKPLAYAILDISVLHEHHCNTRYHDSYIEHCSTTTYSSKYIMDILYSWYFSPGENFHQFRHLLPLAKTLSANFFSRINDYTMDMATFTALAKIKSGEISCNTQVLALAKFFSHEIFPLYGNYKNCT